MKCRPYGLPTSRRHDSYYSLGYILYHAVSLKYSDVLAFKRKRKTEQRKLLIEMMKADEESGLYDL